jgi:hypothetical protein
MLADPEPDVFILPLTCTSTATTVGRRRQVRAAAGHPPVRLAPAVDGF